MQDLKLALGLPDRLQTWRPNNLAPCLRQLDLSLSRGVPLDLRLDLSGLAGLQQLEQLCIRGECVSLAGLGSLAGHSRMRALTLEVEEPAEQVDWGQLLGGMPRLDELALPFLRCSSGLWQQLAGRLSYLRCLSLDLAAASAAERSPVVQRLQLGDLQLPVAQRAGCLVRLVLQLESLEVVGDDDSWVPGIAGHPVLSQLIMGQPLDGWGRQPFSICPRLRKI